MEIISGGIVDNAKSYDYKPLSKEEYESMWKKSAEEIMPEVKDKLIELAVGSGMYDPEHDRIHFDLLDDGSGFKVIIEKGLPVEYFDIDFYIENKQN